MRSDPPDGDGDWSSIPQAMGMFAPGHFSIHPDDLDGRKMVTTVTSGFDGKELTVEFKATITIHMEISAFQEFARKQFKGTYWLSEEPVVVED